MMVKNAYPLPLIPDILNIVFEAKVKYFIKPDIWWGYNSVRIRRETSGRKSFG